MDHTPPANPIPNSPGHSVMWRVFGLIILAALVLVALFWIMVKNEQVVDNGGILPPPVAKVNKKDFAPDKTPDSFPSELVALEKGAAVTQNYNATLRDGQFQATRAYETAKTLAEEFKRYQDYFKANGWKIQSATSKDQPKVIIASKGAVNVLVVFDENKATKINTIVVTATQRQ